MNGPVTVVGITLTERERSLLEFAAHRLHVASMDHANAAAQDKSGRFYRAGAVDAFMRDALDASALARLLASAKVQP